MQVEHTPQTRLRWTSTSADHRHVVGLPQFYVTRENDQEWSGTVQGRGVQGGRCFPTGAAAQRAVEAHVVMHAHLNRWAARARV